MRQSLNGRFKLHSPRKDDSFSLFNQVIYLCKLIWRFCMLFFIAIRAVQTRVFVEAEDLGRFGCVHKKKKGESSTTPAQRSTVCTQIIIMTCLSRKMCRLSIKSERADLTACRRKLTQQRPYYQDHGGRGRLSSLLLDRDKRWP